MTTDTGKSVVPKDFGADSGSRPTDRAKCSLVSTKGFDPGEIIALQGGKYSPNLRSFLAKQVRRRAHREQRVYRDNEGQRWIGYIDDEMWFIGTRLWRVLCVGTKAEVGAWPKLAAELAEESDFWPRYAAIGRCAIDEVHAHWFVNGDNRFVYPHQDERMGEGSDKRTCQWCGHEQRRVLWTETVERERWEPALARIEAGTDETENTGSARKGESRNSSKNHRPTQEQGLSI